MQIRSAAIHLLDVRTRMPFQYGIATMTECPHAFVRLRVEIDGRQVPGTSADHLPPKWFTKVPAQSLDQEIAGMLRVIEHAAGAAVGLEAASPFDLWRQLWQRQEAWGRGEQLPPLLSHFGTSLVERALLEAVCRHAGRPFAELLRANAFGIRLGELHPALAGCQPAEFLPARPLERLIARHTIGMADYLTDAEIPAAERLDDGLPQSLEACAQRYALRHFKVKLAGQLDLDRERLLRVREVIRRQRPTDFAFSLDGNEQFRRAAEFRAYWEGLCRTEGLQGFLTHLLYVEQPLHRDAALDPAAGSLSDWPDRPPLIIDESDGDLDSLPRALALGYAGTSHKNCKGVFKGITNACLLEQLRRQGRPVIMSGEDLANIGPVALLQDLAVCASLGVVSVERNGHHFFAGLSMFPRAVQEQMLTHHGDLYQRSRDGWPTLSIRQGQLATGSIMAAPLGVTPVVDVEQFPTLADYRRT